MLDKYDSDANDWHTGYGVIKYDPYRGGMKNKTQWWAVVNVDTEITRYYRWWVKNHYWVDLCKPSWDAHASIIRGEKPHRRLQHLWKKYDGQRIQFEYQHKVRQGVDTQNRSSNKQCYWFVDVRCPQMTKIRDEFELPSHWNFHLTIGRTWY